MTFVRKTHAFNVDEIDGRMNQEFVLNIFKSIGCVVLISYDLLLEFFI